MSFDPPPPPPPPGGGPHQPGGVPPLPSGPDGQSAGGPNDPYSSQPPQYPHQQGAPPPYPGQGGQGYAGVYPENHPNGTLILVLGIISLILCQPVGIVSWVMGNNALREIDSSNTVYSNRGNIVAGKVLGIISVALMVLSVIAIFVFLGLGISFGALVQ